MRTEKLVERIVVDKIVTVKCDFCENQEDNPGRYQFEVCSICHKDLCREHTKNYVEDPYSHGDYPHVDVTACPDCKPIMDEAWEYALEYAPRWQDIGEAAIERFNKIICR